MRAVVQQPFAVPDRALVNFTEAPLPDGFSQRTGAGFETAHVVNHQNAAPLRGKPHHFPAFSQCRGNRLLADYGARRAGQQLLKDCAVLIRRCAQRYDVRAAFLLHRCNVRIGRGGEFAGEPLALTRIGVDPGDQCNARMCGKSAGMRENPIIGCGVIVITLTDAAQTNHGRRQRVHAAPLRCTWRLMATRSGRRLRYATTSRQLKYGFALPKCSINCFSRR